jgi:serine/threonine protein kinase
VGRLVAGRYRVQRLLGKGGMGAVWLADDEVLMRPVAIKEFTLPEDVMDREAASTSVLREARAASQISHPGVVGVYDLAVEDGRRWIVMEALGGQTLAQVIRQEKRLPVERVIDIGLRLLEALRAVHGEGIVHRDVKPSNVQLCGAGRVVLTDFGLASSDDVALADGAGQFFGSPPYTAPEAVRGGTYRPASDLFSLGATLYAAVEGHQPFGDLTPFSTLMAVLHEPPTTALHAGRLGPVIDGLLTKDPAKRLSLQEAYLWLRDLQSELVTGV